MKRIWIPQAIAILMLLWAMYPENPYGYYVLLRVICCALFMYLCFASIRLKVSIWAWILGVTAFVYNPIIPLHLNRDLWTVVNIITVIIATVSIFTLRGKD